MSRAHCLIAVAAVITGLGCSHDSSLTPGGMRGTTAGPAQRNLVAIALQPRMVEGNGRIRVLLNLVLQNLTDEILEIFPAQVYATCESTGKIVTIHIAGGPEVPYLGLKETPIRGRGEIEYEKLAPRQRLTVHDMDVTDFYEFPSSEATLTFDLEGGVVAGKHYPGPPTKAKTAVLLYRPANRDPLDALPFLAGMGVARRETSTSETIISCKH
jgi:hypothetical protein